MMSFVTHTVRKRAALCILAALSAASVNTVHADKNVLDGQWPIIGQNYANTQVNGKEHRINRGNVNSLVEGWDIQLDGPGVASQPTYADGRIYFADSLGTVYAADAETGAIVWQTAIANNTFATSPTLTKDRLYIASTSSPSAPQNSSIMAFDRDTGQLLWSAPLYRNGEFADDFPGNVTAVGDMLIVPVSAWVFNSTFQGHVLAFNRFTGELIWRIDTTSNQFQGNPEFGPGVGSYSAGAVDLKRKLYFVGTGQTFTGVGSPLADSLLAIDYAKGEIVWSFQFETNDVWNPDSSDTPRPFGTFDLDVSTPPNLFTVRVDGKDVDCVGVAAKSGKYKIFERHQKHPASVQPIAALQLDPGSSVGTIQSTPVVHDGILYISSVAIAGEHRLSNDNVYIPGVDPQDPNFFNLLNQASMKTLAIDLERLIESGRTDGTIPSRAIIWTVYTNGVQGRNPLSFANDILYQTSETGFLRALNPYSGNELFYILVDQQPGRPGIIKAGATIAHGRVYVAYGYDPLGYGGVSGGVKAYQLGQP